MLALFTFMHCPLVANQKMRWSIEKTKIKYSTIKEVRKLPFNFALHAPVSELHLAELVRAHDGSPVLAFGSVGGVGPVLLKPFRSEWTSLGLFADKHGGIFLFGILIECAFLLIEAIY